MKFSLTQGFCVHLKHLIYEFVFMKLLESVFQRVYSLLTKHQ